MLMPSSVEYLSVEWAKFKFNSQKAVVLCTLILVVEVAIGVRRVVDNASPGNIKLPAVTRDHGCSSSMNGLDHGQSNGLSMDLGLRLAARSGSDPPAIVVVVTDSEVVSAAVAMTVAVAVICGNHGHQSHQNKKEEGLS